MDFRTTTRMISCITPGAILFFRSLRQQARGADKKLVVVGEREMPREEKQRQQEGAAPYARPHACVYCAAAFRKPGELKKHVRLVHEKRRDHVCRCCSAAFGQASDLKKHMRSQHPNDIPPECPICFKLLAGSATATTPCGHLFCRACIESALALRSECPSCMQACNAGELHVQLHNVISFE